MWRSFFIAVGLSAILLGLECLFIDKAILAERRGIRAMAGESMSLAPTGMRKVTPTEWMPWSLMSAGAVVMLYTITVPKKLNG